MSCLTCGSAHADIVFENDPSFVYSVYIGIVSTYIIFAVWTVVIERQYSQKTVVRKLFGHTSYIYHLQIKTEQLYNMSISVILLKWLPHKNCKLTFLSSKFYTICWYSYKHCIFAKRIKILKLFTYHVIKEQELCCFIFRGCATWVVIKNWKY